jgi:RHS repeat-associated protein
VLNTRTSTYQSQINFFVKPLQNQESPSKKCANAYTYGFNAKEKDDETQLLNYGFRMYDPRLGRFISADPVGRQFPFYSPYQYAGNKPIWATDLDGLETNYTNVVDPIPNEKPLYSRRSELDPHSESLQVGKQGVDWTFSTQQNFYYQDGNYKYKNLPGGIKTYFEQLSPVCKVQNYKTILVEQTLVTPEQKAEYKVISKETNKSLHGGMLGTSVASSELAKTASSLVGYKLDDVKDDGGTAVSVNFQVKDINDPNIGAIQNSIAKSSGLPVKITENKGLISDYTYSVNYKKSIMTKPGVPSSSTTTTTSETVPDGESYVPCTPANNGGASGGTTEKPPQ